MVQYIGGDAALVCRVCTIALMTFPGPDGTDTLVHTRPWEQYDHDPEPVPAKSLPGRKLVCDFCGELGAAWRYIGANVQSYALDGNLRGRQTQEVDGIWAACDACDTYVKRGDIDGLKQHYDQAVVPQRSREYLSSSLGPAFATARLGEAAMKAQYDLWAAYLSTITRREKIVAPKELAPMRPAQMPKIRDRLVSFWNHQAARDGMREDLRQCRYVPMPGFLVGRDDFLVSVGSLPDHLLDAYVERLSRSLNAAELYWVSPQFTHLAVTSGKELPDVSIERDELPSAHGLVIYENPIHEILRPSDVPVRIMAAGWMLVPGGIWVTVYIRPEDVMTVDPEQARAQVGWLMPWSTGGGAAFGTHKVDSEGDNLLMRSLVATWLLMRQPGVADKTTAAVHTDIRKKYKKAGRSEPQVHVVNIRRTERTTRAAGDNGRTYTGAWKVGWRTGGFWRTYWTGPGRSVRDRRWIDPYIARADLPLKGGQTPKPTVKVLR